MVRVILTDFALAMLMEPLYYQFTLLAMCSFVFPIVVGNSLVALLHFPIHWPLIQTDLSWFWGTLIWFPTSEQET